MGQCAADRSVHLRHATQTVRILNARITLDMRLANFAAFHQREEMFGYLFLTGVRTRILKPRIEGDRCTFQGFETHGAGSVRDAREAFRAQKRQSTDGMHRLGAMSLEALKGT